MFRGLILLSGLILACSPVFGANPPLDAPVRAVDLFDDSWLDSPIDLDVKDPPPLLDAAFEADDAATHWRFDERAGAGVVLHEKGRSGRALAVESTGKAPARLPMLRRLVGVKPETAYQMSAWVRAEGLVPYGEKSAGAAVEMFEFASPDGAPLVTHQHLPRARGTTDWNLLEYSFRTTEATRFVSVRLVSVVNGDAEGRALYDDVRLVEVPRITELLQKDALRTKTREKPVHPLVKRVSLDRFDYRPAILSPISMSWTLPVRSSKDLLLRLAVGTTDLGAAENARGCFIVSWIPVDGSGAEAAPRTLLNRCMASETIRWKDEVIDLETTQGGKGSLRFQTTLPPGVAGYWANPQLVRKQRAEGDDRPHLVLLVFDTMRADHLGFDGYDRPTSPALDALAKRSVQFSRAYSVSPWTAPSLSSIMTSRYPSQHRGGLRIERERRHREPKRPEDGDADQGWENRLLGDLFQRVTALNYHSIREEETTLAERLRAAGYTTLGFHSNYNSSGILGLSRGFDRYQLFSGVAPEGAQTGVDLVRGWLAARRSTGEEGPFFIMLHTQDAHIPYRLRPELAETFGPAPEEDGEFFRTVPWGPKNWALEFWDFEILRTGKAREHVQTIKNFYDSEIAFADQAMATLIADLDAHLPKTAIVLTADHGEEFNEHGQFEHGHSLYDETLRVPLLVRLPDERHAGTVIDEPVSVIDVAPTLLQMAGADPIPETEGRVLISADPKKRQRRRDVIFAGAMLRGSDRSAVLDGPWKFIFHHPLGYLDPYPEERFLEDGLTANTGREELFHLGEDPKEQTDLLAEKPEVADRLRRKLHAFMAETAHGVHLRCGGGAELTVAFSETLGQMKTLTLEDDDVVEIDDERRRTTLKLQGDEDWVIARLLQPEARVAVRAQGKVRLYAGASKKPSGKRGLDFSLGDEDYLSVPTSAPDGRGPWCRIWHVPGGDASSVETLDNEVAEQLKALGYM